MMDAAIRAMVASGPTLISRTPHERIAQQGADRGVETDDRVEATQLRIGEGLWHQQGPDGQAGQRIDRQPRTVVPLDGTDRRGSAGGGSLRRSSWLDPQVPWSCGRVHRSGPARVLSTHLLIEEIAERFHVSRHTVKSQVVSIYSKLGVSSRGEAVDQAIEIGLLEPFPGLRLTVRTSLD